MRYDFLSQSVTKKSHHHQIIAKHLTWRLTWWLLWHSQRKDHHLAQAIWGANLEQLDSYDIAKDCLLTCQEQACLLLVHLVGRSFIRLSQCQNYLVYFYRQKYGYWIRPSNQGHRQKSFSRPDQKKEKLVQPVFCIVDTGSCSTDFHPASSNWKFNLVWRNFAWFGWSAVLLSQSTDKVHTRAGPLI